MTLKEHIDDTRKRLEQKEYTDEAAVRQGIIDRLLGALAWPMFDTKIVFPEYGVDRGNVDYALCHPASTPRVFIEVKRVGNIDKGTEQLFDYAYRIGVTILILTDGQKWRFYHPAGEGSYEDRKVTELDFIVGNSEECAKRLDRYLNYESVKIGKAAEVIAKDYRNIVNQRQIEERLPEVWSELVQEQNETLLRVVMEKAKEKVGHEPTEKQVLTFLKNLRSETVSERRAVISHPVSKLSSSDSVSRSSIVGLESKPSSSHSKSKAQRLIVTMPDGKVINHFHAKDTFVEVIEELGLEEVMCVNPTIVRSEPFGLKREDYKIICIPQGKYFINNDNKGFRKKEILERLAAKLGIQLKVELTDKH